MSAILARISEMTFADFILIGLAGLEVTVAILTLLVAIAALWGYATIKREARDIAETTAQETARKTAQDIAQKTASEKTDRYMEEDFPKKIWPKIDDIMSKGSGLYQGIEKPTTDDIIDKDSETDKKETNHA